MARLDLSAITDREPLPFWILRWSLMQCPADATGFIWRPLTRQSARGLLADDEAEEYTSPASPERNPCSFITTYLDATAPSAVALSIESFGWMQRIIAEWSGISADSATGRFALGIRGNWCDVTTESRGGSYGPELVFRLSRRRDECHS